MTTRSTRKPATPNSETAALPVEEIVPDLEQPRKTFTPDGLGSLAQSLLETGPISPIVVRPAPEGKHMIVVGERRWRAAKEAGLSHVDCIIRHDIDEQEAREMQFAENYQREDVLPLEQAISWRAYLDNYGLSQSELSRRTGIPQRTISDRLALLTLPASVHARMKAGEIGPYEAIKISALPAEQQEAVVEAVCSGKIGGRMLEKLVKLTRSVPQKPVQDLIEELASPEAASVSPPKTTGLPVTKPMPHVYDDIESDPEILKLKKEIRKAELERELGRAKTPPEVAALVASARLFGTDRQEKCIYRRDGYCILREWANQHEIPEGIGEPIFVQEEEPHWHVKPSCFYCAVCTVKLEDDMDYVQSEVSSDPLAGARYKITCDNCGSRGLIAAAIKCTKCGKETRWGWFPEQ